MSSIETLDKEDLSLLITKNGECIFSAKEGGITPLINAIEDVGKRRLAGSSVTDRVVGKAAALLMAYCRVKEVKAKLLSEKAVLRLKKSSIPYHYRELVDEIKTRDQTGTCIFELTVAETEDPQEAYRELRAKVQH